MKAFTGYRLWSEDFSKYEIETCTDGGKAMFDGNVTLILRQTTAYRCMTFARNNRANAGCYRSLLKLRMCIA